MKSAEEKLELMEKSVRNYRVLTVLMAVLLFVGQRDRINNWLDSAEGFISTTASAVGNR